MNKNKSLDLFSQSIFLLYFFIIERFFLSQKKQIVIKFITFLAIPVPFAESAK